MPKQSKKNSRTRESGSETTLVRARTSGELEKISECARRIRDNDKTIQKSQVTSMQLALENGDLLIAGKQKLKEQKIKKRFKSWIEEVCCIPYKRAYNYMRLAVAASQDTSLKHLGLTEAYIKLGLVKRRDFLAEKASSRESKAEVHRIVGGHKIVRNARMYVLDVHDNFNAILADIANDTENLSFILRDGGLFIRFKATQNAELVVAETQNV